MAGKWITQQQVKIYMKAKSQGYTQETSAAKAGLSVRTGREIDQGNRCDPRDKKRHWRTRKDPFNEVWTSQLVPMLENTPALQAITLLEFIQDQYPDKYGDNVLRTLQRRVKKWRATSGPDKEIMFRQQHHPGQQGLSDFTKLKRATITIAGQEFKHLLYHFRLIFSKWSYMKVISGGESYTALASGLQEALQRLGGSPVEHRTDSLSAAYKNLTPDEQQDITKRYEELCDHYTMSATRNNRGRGHENGGVESAHGHLKRRIEQALLLRDSVDFDTVEDYQIFIDDIVQQHNRRNAKSINIERPSLKALPGTTAAEYTEVRAVVSSSSTIDVRKVTYTVPSRLEGETLQVRLYDDRLVCYLGSQHVSSLGRIYPTGKTSRARLVDYRHVIHSLVKKPQAFRYSQIRDDLLPGLHYKNIWAHIDKVMDPRAACKFMVGLLYLAATENCETALAKMVIDKIHSGNALSLVALQAQFKKATTIQSPPVITVEQHALVHYDLLIPKHEEMNHV
jgi:hypothetical protein